MKRYEYAGGAFTNLSLLQVSRIFLWTDEQFEAISELAVGDVFIGVLGNVKRTA